MGFCKAIEIEQRAPFQRLQPSEAGVFNREHLSKGSRHHLRAPKADLRCPTLPLAMVRFSPLVAALFPGD
jgi:hypothetical protein